jgi:hypothetical protein
MVMAANLFLSYVEHGRSAERSARLMGMLLECTMEVDTMLWTVVRDVTPSSSIPFHCCTPPQPPTELGNIPSIISASSSAVLPTCPSQISYSMDIEQAFSESSCQHSDRII